MPLTSSDWHQRFTQQTRWTSSLRQYILKNTQLHISKRILEVGSGTGAVLSALISELQSEKEIRFFGLDIDINHLRYTRNQVTDVSLANGDGHRLPFSNDAFDATLCHYLLMWVANPAQVLREMTRVTRPDGYVIAFAEPDYGGRIDYPQELTKVGQQQALSLEQQGANPQMGRRLKGLFYNTGLEDIDYGVLGGQWKINVQSEDNAIEWKMIQEDLKNLITKDELNHLRQIDTEAHANGERVLYVPTFYAWGRVP